MWRILGDEQIFIYKVTSMELLKEYVDKIFRILISIISELKTGKFFDTEDNSQLMKLQNILSIKATAWIAIVNDIGNINEDLIEVNEGENIFEKYKSQAGYEIYEFLGNDIDTGFRISKKTQDGRLVLSYELAYLISQTTELSSYLHIITYTKLKGIWKGKLYPIVWYHNPKAYMDIYKQELKFEDSFTFDACDENTLVKEYFDNRNDEKRSQVIWDTRMYTDAYYALQKILHDRNLTKKLERLEKIIKETSYLKKRYIDTELMQIHCVAVCYKIENEKIRILVAQRRPDREQFSNKWEFGCAKAVINKSITERIKEEYKNDFGIDIDPILDKDREMKEPIPIALYHVEKEDEKEDKGIITIAKIKNDFEVDMFKESDKHSQLNWIEEEKVDQLDEKYNNAVPDFKATIKKAIEYIKEYENK